MCAAAAVLQDADPNRTSACPAGPCSIGQCMRAYFAYNGNECASCKCCLWAAIGGDIVWHGGPGSDGPLPGPIWMAQCTHLRTPLQAPAAFL